MPRFATLFMDIKGVYKAGAFDSLVTVAHKDMSKKIATGDLTIKSFYMSLMGC